MAGDAHWIMLLSKWLGNKIVVDVGSENNSNEAELTADILDSHVRHVRDTDITLDVTLDDMTCTSTTPPSSKVIITRGRAHWYGYHIELLQNTESPVIDIPDALDCDPNQGGSYRYALLCIYRDLMGEIKFKWVYGAAAIYPQVPHNMIPLCYVKQFVGRNVIEKVHISNWRTIHPTNAPSTQFLFPPVLKAQDLISHNNVPDMAMSFVIGESNWYFYYNGVWIPQSQGTFADTFFSEDVEADTTETALPWAIYNYAELMVYRDGFAMTPNKDYIVEFGPDATIIWNQIIYKNMRIMVIRNPFAGSGFSPEGDYRHFKTIDLWVDGITGLDSLPGTQDKPFKTLQRAFDSIPLSSKHKYVVHARRLQLGDKIDYFTPAITSYGVLLNRRVRSLKLLIEDNCQYDDSLDWLYVLQDVSVVEYHTQTLHYPVLHTECNGTMLDVTWLADNCVFSGGYFIFKNVHIATGTLYVDNAAFLRILESNIYEIYARYAGLAQVVSSVITSIRGSSGGIIQIEYSTVNHGFYTVDSTVAIIASNWVKGGTFISSNVTADSCSIIGKETVRVDTPFNLSFNSTLQWTDNVVHYITGPAVILAHGSRANIQGGQIHKALSDAGIVVRYSSSLMAGGNLQISHCTPHGIYFTYGSIGYLNRVSGSMNLVYGAYANMYSTCERINVSLTGNTADYREDTAGSRTVAADGADEYPLTLDRKIRAGVGIHTEILDKAPPAGNRIMEISLDVNQLTDINGPLRDILDARPRSTVYRHITPILPNNSVDVELYATGLGFLSSVGQRISNPTVRTSTIPTTTVFATAFTQMDTYVGTVLTDIGWQLRDRPGLGYVMNSVYFMHSRTQQISSLPMYTMSGVQKLHITAIAPAGTFVKCAISINACKQFKIWTGTAWVNLQGSTVLAQLSRADLYDTVNNYPASAWAELKSQFNPVHVDIGFAIMSSSSTVTPVVMSYEWEIIEGGYNLDISEKFNKMFYPSRAIFTNTSGETIQPPIYFTVYPLNNYGG